MSGGAPQADAVIEARGLLKRYGDFAAVDGIDFAVRRGECFGFLGPNGAGKTTTMRMIYRAARPTAGALRIAGLDAGAGSGPASAADERAIKRSLGVVPQEDNLDQDLTVRENLEVFARFYKLSRSEARARIEDLIRFFDLAEKADAPVLRLSGGMKRRVLIARALLHDPVVVILDEPTTGLDPQARHHLWERLAGLRRRGATLLLTTHYMDEAERLCDRLVIMDRGRIVASGAPRELIERLVPPHVVEVAANGGAAPAAPPPAVVEAAERLETLSDRLLFYAKDGEELARRAAHAFPDARTLLRRATLEDVFLKITGRRLAEE